MEKRILCRVGMFKPAARKFEQDLNAYLADGWQVDGEVELYPLGFFRYVLMATVEKDSDL